MRRFSGLFVALVLVAAQGCTGDGSSPGPTQAGPPSRSGAVVAIDTCELVSARQMREALSEKVRVVGRRLDPPTLPTESCLWGREFGVELVEIKVTPGPVAGETFEAAFGKAAGGEPRSVAIGDAAYSREGLTSRTLQVLDHGAVVSIEAKSAPGARLPGEALQSVARAVLADMPANPELRHAEPRGRCGRVAEDAVAAAMGTSVRLRRAFVDRAPANAARRPTMCSWAGLPGNVVVTAHTGPVQITNFRANLSPRVYTRVGAVPAEAWSQNSHAGDLLIFLDDAVVEVSVLPGEGYSSPSVPTTDGELKLADALVDAWG